MNGTNDPRLAELARVEQTNLARIRQGRDGMFRDLFAGPVGKHRAMAATSLTDRLRQAATVAEIDALLVEGRGYARATEQSRREWQRIADVRRVALAAPVVPA